MSNYQSSETFAWSLLVSNTESESEMFSEFDRVVARKNTQVFYMTSRKQAVQGENL